MRATAIKCGDIIIMAKIIAASVSTMVSATTGAPYKCYALITEENEVVYAGVTALLLPLTLAGVRNFDNVDDVIEHLVGMDVEKNEKEKVVITKSDKE